MTYKEYKEKKEALKGELVNIKEEILKSLNDKYSRFIGKKVIIRNEYIGFFKGFERDSFGRIMPILLKQKKDVIITFNIQGGLNNE